MRPRLLDLYCKAGGASMGYHRAGFEVTGVDHEPQPHYPFRFILADALEYVRLHGHEYDAIAASPPCQAYTALKVMPNAREHSDLIEPTRAALQQIGLPYVIENVVGAPVVVGQPSLLHSIAGVQLCGSMFGLNNGTYELRRHRLFESNRIIGQPACRHRLPVVGFYGDHARTRQRTVAGHRDRGGDITGTAEKLHLAHELMGIDWMVWSEISQAIPPAFTEYVGSQLLSQLEQAA